jgi:hypothetical protein
MKLYLDFLKIFLAMVDIICIMIGRERKEEKMRIPKTKTIRGKIHGYAYKMGFTIVKNFDGSYSLFDIRMAYYTHKNVDMDTVVRVVVDEMYAKKFREEASLTVGA